MHDLTKREKEREKNSDSIVFLHADWAVDLIRRIRTGRDGWMPGNDEEAHADGQQAKEKSTIHSRDRHWKSIVGNDWENKHEYVLCV